MKIFIKNMCVNFTSLLTLCFLSLSLANESIKKPLIISKVTGEISPKLYTEVYSAKTGKISIIADQNAQVKKGQVIALIDKKQMDLVSEIDQLKNLQKKAKSSTSLIKELENIEKIRENRLSIQQELNFLNSVLETDEHELSEQEKRIITKTITIQEAFYKGYGESLDIYEKALSDNSFTRLEALQEEVQNKEIQRRISEFQTLSNGDGIIRWSCSNGSFIRPNEVVATITDTSEVFITVPSDAVNVTTRIGAKILLTAELQKGTITAKYYSTDKAKDASRSSVNYVFKLTPESSKIAKDFLFVKLVFDLVRQPEDGQFFLKKSEALNKLEKGELLLTWRSLINKHYPEYTLVDIGADELLVKLK